MVTKIAKLLLNLWVFICLIGAAVKPISIFFTNSSEAGIFENAGYAIMWGCLTLPLAFIVYLVGYFILELIFPANVFKEARGLETDVP